MSEEERNNKAKKLAAARKKLKEYQQRNQVMTASTGLNIVSTTTTSSEASISGSGQASSNISEHSESDLLPFNNNINSNNGGLQQEQLSQPENELGVAVIDKKEETTDLSSNLVRNALAENDEERRGEGSKLIFSMNNDQQQNLVLSNYSANTNPETIGEENLVLNLSAKNTKDCPDQLMPAKDNTIQILINEKILLTNELNRCRDDCHNKTKALEELRVSHTETLSRMEELQYEQCEQQQRFDRQCNNVEKLQKELTLLNAQQNENVSHLKELGEQLIAKENEIQHLKNELNESNKKLELSELRIKQLTVDNNSDSQTRNDDKDNQIESLTQTKFMYEQQIRDLQAMLQQSNNEKEQSNAQYLTYVQQLKMQVNHLNKCNADLETENKNFQEHVKQLLKHIQSLEKDIQKKLSKEQEFNENSILETQRRELESLREQIADHELERFEFQLKIRSQETCIEEMREHMRQREICFDEVKKEMDEFLLEKPDNAKLLATMESDKVAASRALTQNTELKKQLDELEKKFVQLTNDKAELMNLWDAEKYANREINSKYNLLEERLHSIDERFKNKDNEMIRLSHENEELNEKNRTLHEEIKHLKEETMKKEYKVSEEPCRTPTHNTQECLDDNCDENSDNVEDRLIVNDSTQKNGTDLSPPPTIATSEAVEKLQQRFNQLMEQVAELTDEKQNLEHLVLQLQSETDTIGEYIALYQNQRRMLKQREYEKAAQTQMLQDERRQMQERLLMLNNLISSLGLEQQQGVISSNKTTEHIPEEVNAIHKDVPTDKEESSPNLTNNHCNNDPESRQEILTKIHQIISDIEENNSNMSSVVPEQSYNSADHLSCCSGKFEVV